MYKVEEDLTLKASMRHLRTVSPLSRALWPGGSGPWSLATLDKKNHLYQQRVKS